MSSTALNPIRLTPITMLLFVLIVFISPTEPSRHRLAMMPRTPLFFDLVQR